MLKSVSAANAAVELIEIPNYFRIIQSIIFSKNVRNSTVGAHLKN